MQYEPEIMFECDGCGFTEAVIPDYVFHSYSGKSGHYDDKAASDKIVDDYGWEIDDDKHYCSAECWYEVKENKGVEK
tara:strand:+ start:1262 stop:1492 length:231 start_codon:yes stop_codon:yes gene_type:complete